MEDYYSGGYNGVGNIMSSEGFSPDNFLKVKKELDEKYNGKYILLKDSEVIAIVDKLEEAYEVLRKKGLKKCTIYKAGDEVETSVWGWGSIEP